MKKLSFLYVLGLTLLVSCRKDKTEYSAELTEPATVADLVYVPSRHGSGSGAGPTIDLTGEGGIGLAFTSVTVDIPEKYAVVFQCEHGKFIIEGDQKRAKRLWNTLKEGQQVTVRYREVYRTTYIDGKPTERHLVKYDFIDAQ